MAASSSPTGPIRNQSLFEECLRILVKTEENPINRAYNIGNKINVATSKMLNEKPKSADKLKAHFSQELDLITNLHKIKNIASEQFSFEGREEDDKKTAESTIMTLATNNATNILKAMTEDLKTRLQIVINGKEKDPEFFKDLTTLEKLSKQPSSSEAEKKIIEELNKHISTQVRIAGHTFNPSRLGYPDF